MNLIQEKCQEVKWYTNLSDVFDWLQINASDYDWHFSDVDGGWKDICDPEWVTGDYLEEKLNEAKYQFFWSVISAFPKGTKPFTTDEPYADGNKEFWSGVPNKQLKEALFEIVCWDGSATLFIGLSNDLSEVLMENAPGIKNLDIENENRKC